MLQYKFVMESGDTVAERLATPIISDIGKDCGIDNKITTTPCCSSASSSTSGVTSPSSENGFKSTKTTKQETPEGPPNQNSIKSEENKPSEDTNQPSTSEEPDFDGFHCPNYRKFFAKRYPKLQEMSAIDPKALLFDQILIDNFELLMFMHREDYKVFRKQENEVRGKEILEEKAKQALEDGFIKNIQRSHKKKGRKSKAEVERLEKLKKKKERRDRKQQKLKESAQRRRVRRKERADRRARGIVASPLDKEKKSEKKRVHEERKRAKTERKAQRKLKKAQEKEGKSPDKRHKKTNSLANF
ncbi:unnamed protein product [Bursaphelenchus okinawaensis]|uniref:Uncharacterized protein n=1 Tax=Bursaphelenchus okinawaensis TaxID=465554 RepID=A0A811KHT8_9BILA|nr:unnamed protein product [Bursaphelenchus okinawaensis]CAG9102706.1 unnamed protein product [Bursaphelenchus okinawaensis]